MTLKSIALTLAITFSLLPSSTFAGFEDFYQGSAIPAYGKIANVENEFPLVEGAQFKVSFDISKAGTPGKINRQLESAARFINMHVEAGMALEDLQLAVVIHGAASADVTDSSFYQAKYDTTNANLPLINTLKSKGVRIYLCGQSAVANNITNGDLAQGVAMALSAMTAHAQLRNEGFGLNPF